MKKAYPWVDSYDSDIQWEMSIKPVPVFSLLDETAKLYPNKPGFNFLGKKTTWRQIHTQVNRFAAGLQKQGVKKGDRIGLFLPNCPYFLIAY